MRYLYGVDLKSLPNRKVAPNSKVDEDAAKADRRAGMTWSAIAKKYGVTTERVRQICHDMRGRDHFQAFSKKRCIFDGLRDWLNLHMVTVDDLAQMICGHPDYNAANRWRGMLNGTTRITKRDIDAALSVTGMSYEEAFKEDGV